MQSCSTTCARDSRWSSAQPVSRTTSTVDETQVDKHRHGHLATGETRPVRALLPIMAVVLSAFLVIGLALPVLPLHVHQDLGLSAFVVGLVTGSQFAASLVSRVW